MLFLGKTCEKCEKKTLNIINKVTFNDLTKVTYLGLRSSLYNFYEAGELRLQLLPASLLFEKALERSHYYLRTLDLEPCLIIK